MTQTKKQTVKNSISSSGELLLYGDIGDYWDEMDALSVVKQLEQIDSKDITVRVHSAGGLITEGLAIYNRLNESKAFVTVHVDGLAASMASVVCMAGDKIVMPDNALMMIHKPWNMAIGDAEEMRKTADSLDVFEESILSIYMSRTNLSKDELQAMLSDETWLSAEQAIEYGFADELSEPIQAAASLDLSKFAKAPDTNELFFHEAKKVASNQSKMENPKMTTKVKDEAAENKVADVEIAKELEAKENAKAAADKAVAKERQRSADIRSIGSKASLSTVQINQLIDDGVSVDKAREAALNCVSERDAEFVPNNHISVSDAPDGAKDAMKNALIHRIDPSIKLESGRDFVGMNLMDMARASLDMAGIGSRGLTPNQIAAQALHSTSDFPYILADVANKSLRQGYDAAPRTFMPFTRQTSASDFKTINRAQLGEAPDLTEVNEAGEFSYGTLGEAKESYSLATFGKIIPLSRQLIINDDLDALSRIPSAFGASAAELESTTVWGKITANAAMNDSVALFHATHKNLGSAGALSETTLAEARKLMRKQTGINTSRPMNLMGEYLIVPAALEVAALKLLASITSATSANVNVFSGGFTLIVEPRLDANSATAWYIACAPSRIDTIEYAYLSGNEGVYIETEQGFDVDGMKIKARMDFGAGVIDFRGLFKNAGA